MIPREISCYKVEIISGFAVRLTENAYFFLNSWFPFNTFSLSLEFFSNLPYKLKSQSFMSVFIFSREKNICTVSK